MGQETELAPCPFCGSQSVRVVMGESFRWRVAVCDCCNARGPDVRVQTAGKGTQEDWERTAEAGAVVEWNRRPNVI